jgi:hypothetical protein
MPDGSVLISDSPAASVQSDDELDGSVLISDQPAATVRIMDEKS